MPTCISFFLSAWRADVSDWSLFLKLLTCCSKPSRSLRSQQTIRAVLCRPYIFLSIADTHHLHSCQSQRLSIHAPCAVERRSWRPHLFRISVASGEVPSSCASSAGGSVLQCASCKRLTASFSCLASRMWGMTPSRSCWNSLHRSPSLTPSRHHVLPLHAAATLRVGRASLSMSRLKLRCDWTKALTLWHAWRCAEWC